MNVRLIVAATVLAASTGGLFVFAQPAQKNDNRPVEKTVTENKAGEVHGSVWMKRKLEFAKNILEGITSADVQKVVENAESMRTLSKVEYFVRNRSPGYKTHLEIFEHANDQLIREARKENLDGAALAFTQMTISCINCHKHLRDEATKK